MSPSAQLYITHRNSLIALAKARGLDAHDAEDVVHDLFATLLRIDRLDETSTLAENVQGMVLGTRLKSMIINRWRDHHRARRDVHRTLPLAEVPHLVTPLSSDLSPAEAMDRAWAESAITAALALLRSEISAKQWHIIEPVLLDDVRPNTGPSSSKHRVAVHRARKRLRAILPPDELRAAMSR
jgi:DNA-directed RNA polymerase specialized sigma24 family protein